MELQTAADSAAFPSPDVKTRNYNLADMCYFKMLGNPPVYYIFLIWNSAACPRTCRAGSPSGHCEVPEERPVSAVLDHAPATNHFHSPSLEADDTYCEKWKYHNLNKGDSLPHKSSLPVSSTSCLSTPTNDIAVAGQAAHRGIWSRAMFKIRSRSCLSFPGSSVHILCQLSTSPPRSTSLGRQAIRI